MNAKRWLRNLICRPQALPRGMAAGRTRQIRLQVESLEARCLPSIVTLASLADAPDGVAPRIVNALLFQARSHEIGIPRADLTERFGQAESPNACLICHANKGAPWAEQQLQKW